MLPLRTSDYSPSWPDGFRSPSILSTERASIPAAVTNVLWGWLVGYTHPANGRWSKVLQCKWQCNRYRIMLSQDASVAAMIGDIFQFQRSRATHPSPLD
jgi:hypothetical protein